MKLTGKLRFDITKVWMQRGMEGDLEEFIKKVCEAKNITYTPPKKEKQR